MESTVGPAKAADTKHNIRNITRIIWHKDFLMFLLLIKNFLKRYRLSDAHLRWEEPQSAH
jgi:hypothetical protein